MKALNGIAASLAVTLIAALFWVSCEGLRVRPVPTGISGGEGDDSVEVVLTNVDGKPVVTVTDPTAVYRLNGKTYRLEITEEQAREMIGISGTVR